MTESRSQSDIHQICNLRDSLPYSSRNSAKGALIQEAATVFSALSDGSVEDVRKALLEGQLLGQKARATRKSIWDCLHYRYFSPGIDWIIQDLVEARCHGGQWLEFRALLYFHYAVRDRLTYDFVTQMLWQRWQQREFSVSSELLLNLLDDAPSEQSKVTRWSESTRRKLAQNTLAALRDFAVLEGAQKKRLARPRLPTSSARHILRVLIGEGNRGGQVLAHSDWQLFMLSQDGVADLLSRVAQQGRIGFERVGNTVVLDTPDEWSQGA